jgi:hypothetical protein
MVIHSDTVVESGDWKIVHIESEPEIKHKEDSEHYVLKNTSSGGNISIPFTHVIASGSIIEFWRCENLDTEYAQIRSECNRTGSLSEMLTGLNTLKEDSALSEEIFEELQEIGPW